MFQVAQIRLYKFNKMNKAKTLLSQREAATYLGVSRTTLSRYRRFGYFGDTIETRNAILFLKEDLDKFASQYYFRRGKKSPQTRQN
jgi:transcriptional regulator with XRE-family HTH domain